jgi:hypothetical protein
VRLQDAVRGDHMEVIALLQKYGGKVRPARPPLVAAVLCHKHWAAASTQQGHLAGSVELGEDNAAAMLLPLNCCR